VIVFGWKLYLPHSLESDIENQFGSIFQTAICALAQIGMNKLLVVNCVLVTIATLFYPMDMIDYDIGEIKLSASDDRIRIVSRLGFLLCCLATFSAFTTLAIHWKSTSSRPVGLVDFQVDNKPVSGSGDVAPSASAVSMNLRDSRVYVIQINDGL